MLKTHPLTALSAALVIALATAAAQAQTLRWASQGDAQTMDPHSQNESLSNAINGQVYEGLVGRDKQLNYAPALAVEWQQTSPTVWRIKLRPNVKFHDGSPLTVMTRSRSASARTRDSRTRTHG